jgi:hypothetical protein
MAVGQRVASYRVITSLGLELASRMAGKRTKAICCLIRRGEPQRKCGKSPLDRFGRFTTIVPAMSENQNKISPTSSGPINRRDVKSNFISVTCLATSLFQVCGADKQKQHPSLDADTVVWVGLDYSMVRMIGGNDFRVPDVIFPAMLEKWNTLFLDERIELVARAMGKQVAWTGKGSDRRFVRYTMLSQGKLDREHPFAKASPIVNVLIWKTCRFRMQKSFAGRNRLLG